MSKRSDGKPFCPECGNAATGNFCQHCGAKLGGRFCNQCGSKIAPNAKFCNQCGDKAGAGGGGGHRAAAAETLGGQNLPWWIAGIALFGLIVVVGTTQLVRGGPSEPAPVQPAAVQPAPRTSAGTLPDLSSMTPIEAADRLFKRVMTAVAAGDSVQAQQFMPMAVGAYERARPLDADGLFHLSMLLRTAGALEDALANAQQILDSNPDHLLGLQSAAAAAAQLGRDAEAAEYYRHIVDVFSSEMARPLPEYVDHGGVTDDMLSVAEAFLAAR
jgi:tetratricopeptide (TPR) repeat protein